MFKSKKFLFKIILASIMIALNVIIERFLSYNVWNMQIGFSFITVAFAAVFLGVPYSVAVATFGDLIGAILFPAGAYFFGFTLTNAIAGLVTGIFLYKNVTIIKIGLSVLINKIATTLLLNTVWISILYRGGLDAFPAVLVTRIPQACIMFFVEIIVLTILFSEKSKVRNTLNKSLQKFF